MSAEGKLYRYIDQVCFFVREEGRNEIHMQVVDGNLMVRELPKGLIARMKRHGISEPFAVMDYCCWQHFYYSLSGRDISAAVLYLFLLCGVWIKC